MFVDSQNENIKEKKSHCSVKCKLYQRNVYWKRPTMVCPWCKSSVPLGSLCFVLVCSKLNQTTLCCCCLQTSSVTCNSHVCQMINNVIACISNVRLPRLFQRNLLEPANRSTKNVPVCGEHHCVWVFIPPSLFVQPHWNRKIA